MVREGEPELQIATHHDRQGTPPAPDPPADRARRVVVEGHAGALDRARLDELLADPQAPVRAAALGAAARHGALPVDVLVSAMDDTDAQVRLRACELAGHRAAAGGWSATLGTSLCAALDDPDPVVAEMAAWAIGEAGDAAGPPAVRRLGETAKAHKDALCREAAIAALGAIGDPAGLDAVIAGLDDKPAVRRRCAVALAAFDDPAAEEGLRRCLGDRDWQVRQAAEELLDGA